MSPTDPNLREALSAWMDGELPADEARFLARRIAADPALREQYERWQLASAALRGQPLWLMPERLADDIGAAVAAQSPRTSRRWPWAAGAAAAALVLALLPGLLDTGTAPVIPAPPGLVVRADPAPLELAPRAPVSPLPESDRGLALGTEPVARPWPRSPLARSPREMDAYLVRHNAMVAADGLGGFIPYVDVVVHDEPNAGADVAEPVEE